MSSAFCLLVLTGLHAQKDFHFETFSTRDGLSNNEVRSILRDRRGFLWIGTAHGLNRFDGDEFVVFLPENRHNSIRGAYIAALAEDARGRVWIGHNLGIDVYDPARDSFIQIDITFEPEISWTFNNWCSLVVTGDQQVVVSIEKHKLLVMDTDGRNQRWLSTPDVPPAQRPAYARGGIRNEIFRLTPRSDTAVWMNSQYGIFSLTPASGAFTFFPINDIPFTYNPGHLFYDRQREWLWFEVFGEGIFSFDYRSGTFRKWDGLVPATLMVANHTMAGPLDDGGIWLNVPGVLYPESGRFVQVKHFPDDPYSFPEAGNVVSYCDETGILWIGTTKGLVKMDPMLQGFRQVILAEQKPAEYDNTIYDFYDNPGDGLLYVTSFYTNQLFAYDRATGRARDIRREFRPEPKGSFTQIFRDSRGLTWLLADGEVYQADLSGRRLRRIPLPAPPPGSGHLATFEIAEDARGDLWITKWRAGVLHYLRDEDRLVYHDFGPDVPRPGTVYYVVAADGGKKIWVGTVSQGLFYHDIRTGQNGHIVSVDLDGKPFPVENITGLATDADNNLWIGTRQGLLRRKAGGAVRLFDEEDGLGNTQIEGLIPDQAGNLWMGTGSGISCLDTRTLRFCNFDERHGLKTDVLLDAFSVISTGEIFTSTKRGFIYFHPDSLPRDTRPPRLAFTALSVGGVDYRPDGLGADYLSEITLQPRENFFSISFTAPGFTLPEETVFMYQLQGFNPDWVDAGKNRTATFTNVPPGRYTFCLKARNRDGIWSEQPKTLQITVLPPFWRRAWFIGLITLLLAGTTYSAYAWRTGQIRKEEQMKTAFNKKLAEVEMAALRSQMNPHFLFNCLNSINRFIQRNEPDAASSYLTKFSRLIRLVLDNSRSNLISLRDEMEALRLYLELEAMRFVNRFKYEISISPDLDINSIEIPPMLIQPYVENAIWHGLMHKMEDDGMLCVRVFPNPGMLIIEVEDNGVGREMARSLKSKSATLHKSHGMKMTAERIQIINELYQSRAAIKIRDLFNDQGRPAGTLVTLTLPLD